MFNKNRKQESSLFKGSPSWQGSSKINQSYQNDDSFDGDFNQSEFSSWTAGQQQNFSESQGHRDIDYGDASSSFRHSYGGDDTHRGVHFGKGPKDYRRSDERIREDVNDVLTAHGDIDASDVTVNVGQGVVTLSGSVVSRQMKRSAEDAIVPISGVSDIRNELRIETTPTV